MQTKTPSRRIESIDLLKGLVMVVMALDHVRDYFHFSAFYFDPGDPEHSNLPIFFTRWITHFCAPSFSFLAGMSAFMVGKRKSRGELSAFLFKRGLWLVFIELSFVIFGWMFDVHFHLFLLVTIWSLGMSMVVLAALVYLPRNFILVFGVLMIGAHNLLDTVHVNGSLLWGILHEPMPYQLPGERILFVGYPLIPWMAVMALGYYFGAYYDRSVEAGKRRRTFNIIGISAIALFVLLRFTNLYGDANLFTRYESISSTLISFFNPTKYPPSLLYLLMTMGAAFIFLANSEKWKGRLVDFFCTFGRVPFFYYILHLYLVHLGAMLLAQLTGYGWQKMLLNDWVGEVHELRGYGLPLWGVYLVWVAVILILYPLCKSFDRYKQAHKEKWWLSYL